MNITKRSLTLLSTLFLFACSPLEFTSATTSYHPPLPQFKKTKVAVVLGGGGAKGLAHVGVLEELLAHDIKPDLIVGCSAGAIVGGLYADTPDIAHLKQLLIDKKRDELLDISLENLPFGFSNGLALQEFLTNQLNSKQFEQLKIPFVAVATNLEFGDMTTFGTGPLTPAVMASAAFPGMFLPIKIEGQYFVDGGVANPVPVEVARKLGAQFVIAVELAGELPDTPPNHIFGILRRSLEISYTHQSKMASEGADFVIRVPFKDIGTFEDGLNQYIYEMGKYAASSKMPELKEKLTRVKKKKIKK